MINGINNHEAYDAILESQEAGEVVEKLRHVIDKIIESYSQYVSADKDIISEVKDCACEYLLDLDLTYATPDPPGSFCNDGWTSPLVLVNAAINHGISHVYHNRYLLKEIIASKESGEVTEKLHLSIARMIDRDVELFLIRNNSWSHLSAEIKVVAMANCMKQVLKFQPHICDNPRAYITTCIKCSIIRCIHKDRKSKS